MTKTKDPNVYSKHPALVIYLISRWFYLHNLELIAKIFYRLNNVIFSCSIAYEADIDKSVRICHPRGTFINPGSKIGARTILFQSITLGSKEIVDEVDIVIGKNCLLGANVCVLGKVKIGDNVKIGANSVVTKNISSNCTVVGVPAKIVKKKKGSNVNRKQSRKSNK